MDLESLNSRSSRSLPKTWPRMGEAQIRSGTAVLGRNTSGLPEVGSRGDGSAEESTITGQSSGGDGSRNRRRTRGTAVSEDESSPRLASTSNTDDLQPDSDVKRLKLASCRDNIEDSKLNTEVNYVNYSKPIDQSAQPSEEPKQDYIHVRARRGQATDSHSLAERARREKISERMKILQDLVPGCNKVIGKASVLDEIINYIQSLQCQVEFLSLKLETINSKMNSSIDELPVKDFGIQTFDRSSGMAFGSQPAGQYGQGSSPELLHMQVGCSYDRAA